MVHIINKYNNPEGQEKGKWPNVGRGKGMRGVKNFCLLQLKKNVIYLYILVLGCVFLKSKLCLPSIPYRLKTQFSHLFSTSLKRKGYFTVCWFMVQFRSSLKQPLSSTPMQSFPIPCICTAGICQRCCKFSSIWCRDSNKGRTIITTVIIFLLAECLP